MNKILNNISNKKNGFTLIELVVVIAIMAILSLIIAPNVTAYVKKSDSAKIQENLRQFHHSAELVDKTEKGYKLANNTEAGEDFLLKTGFFSTAEGEELSKYKVFKADEGIYVEYKQLGKVYKFPNWSIRDVEDGEIVEDDEDEVKPKVNYIKSGTIVPYEVWNINMVKQKVKMLNLNTVLVPIRVIVNNANSSNMSLYPNDVEHSKILIKELNTMGVDVILEPFPWIASGSIVETKWEPDNINTWFWNWKTEVLKPLTEQIAKPYNVKYMTVSNNFVHMEYATGYWTDLFREVKQDYGYKGKTIYKTNWWVTATWDSATTDSYNNKLNNSLFGSSNLDIISIASYFELTDTAKPTINELKSSLKGTTKFNRGQNVFQEIKNFNTKWGKPIMFGELAAPNYDGYASEPWNTSPSGYGSKYNKDAQHNYFKAYTDIFGEESWFKGFSIFALGDSTSSFDIKEQNIIKTIHDLESK